MLVTLRLHAVLRDLLPGGKAEIDVTEGSSLTELLDSVGVEPELRELVTVNGTQIVGPLDVELSEGDSIEVFPAVAGGTGSAYLDEGIKLFERGEYFLSHETLEEHWIEAPLEERDFYQGLIHLAVGFLHHTRGNNVGAGSQFAKAKRRLASYPDDHEGVEISEIRSFLESAAGRIERGEDLIPPTIRRLS